MADPCLCLITERSPPPVRPFCHTYSSSQPMSQSLSLVKHSAKEEVHEQESKGVSQGTPIFRLSGKQNSPGNSNDGTEITPKAASTHRYGNSGGNVAPLALGGFLELTPQKPTEFSSSNAQS